MKKLPSHYLLGKLWCLRHLWHMGAGGQGSLGSRPSWSSASPPPEGLRVQVSEECSRQPFSHNTLRFLAGSPTHTESQGREVLPLGSHSLLTGCPHRAHASQMANLTAPQRPHSTWSLRPVALSPHLMTQNWGEGEIRKTAVAQLGLVTVCDGENV